MTSSTSAERPPTSSRSSSSGRAADPRIPPSSGFHLLLGLGEAGYAWDEEKRSYTALSLDVLTLSGARAAEVTSFITPYTRGLAREQFAADVFACFDLPGRLD